MPINCRNDDSGDRWSYDEMLERGVSAFYGYPKSRGCSGSEIDHFMDELQKRKREEEDFWEAKFLEGDDR